MRKATERYRTYSIPGKTAALVPEFEVEVLPSAELQPRFLRLPLDRTTSLGPAFVVTDLPLGRTL